MILMIGRLQIQTDKVTDFQSFARETVEKERHVEGCIGFEILQDVIQADRFVMIEQWRDRAALDQHLSTSEFARSEASLIALLSAEADWSEYEV